MTVPSLSLRASSRVFSSVALFTAGAVTLLACGDDDGSTGGFSGAGGSPSGGRAGAGGSVFSQAGRGGASGTAGKGGQGGGGSSSKGGSAGKGGSSGKGGSAGKGGTGGSGGTGGGKTNWKTCTSATATFHATAAKGTCDLEAVLCLQSANGDADLTDACGSEYPQCLSCLDDTFSVCTIGTKAKPGVCRGLYGCYEGCVFEACPETNPSQACVDAAASGPCASALTKYQTCIESATACVEKAQTTCGLGVATCPEAEPSSAIGTDVFTGSLFHAPNTLGNLGSSCGDAPHDRVRQWTAPADGTYTFTLRTTFTAAGMSAPTTASHLILLRGTDCGNSTVLACDSAGQSPPSPATETVTLVAGDAVLVGASSSFPAGSSTTAADYAVDITSCTPACDGKTCGPDGCGATCGTCTGKDTCEAGVCTACKPACDGKTCGDDGCGSVCGTCTGTDLCTAGVCTACVPKCDGKACGSDGCSGSCGTCEAGKTCTAGVCQTPPPPSCDPVADTGCDPAESCYILASEKRQCALRSGTGKRGSSCSDSGNCDGGFACFAGQCRAVCKKTADDCLANEDCASVSGWITFGTCAAK